MENIINPSTLKDYQEFIERGLTLLKQQQYPVNIVSCAMAIDSLNTYLTQNFHMRYKPVVNWELYPQKLKIYVHVADICNNDDWVAMHSLEIGNVQETPKPEIKSKPEKKTVSFSNTKYKSENEYFAFVAKIFSDLNAEYLTKDMIKGFLGGFIDSDTAYEWHPSISGAFKLQKCVIIDCKVKDQFKIDWSYFTDNYKRAIYLFEYNSPDDTIHIKANGGSRFVTRLLEKGDVHNAQLTTLGRTIWTKMFGATTSKQQESDALVASRTSQLLPKPINEEKVAVAPIEHICFNCKMWKCGHNNGNEKIIAAKCPIKGRKTLTDDSCGNFVAVKRTED